MGGRIIVQQKKISSRTQLDKPVECASGGDPLLLYKTLHLLFSPLVWILSAQCFESWKKLLTWSWCGIFGISVSAAKGMSHWPIKTCHFALGSQAKHQVSSPILILLKKMFVCVSHHDNVLARCDLIFPLCRCQGVWNKTRTQLCLSKILFQNLKNYSLGDVQRFCYHSWCDLMVIFDQISNSSNVFLNFSQFWTASSLIIFYQLPSISKSRIPPKNFWSVQSLIPIRLLHQY